MQAGVVRVGMVLSILLLTSVRSRLAGSQNTSLNASTERGTIAIENVLTLAGHRRHVKCRVAVENRHGVCLELGCEVVDTSHFVSRSLSYA